MSTCRLAGRHLGIGGKGVAPRAEWPFGAQVNTDPSVVALLPYSAAQGVSSVGSRSVRNGVAGLESGDIQGDFNRRGPLSLAPIRPGDGDEGTLDLSHSPLEPRDGRDIGPALSTQNRLAEELLERAAAAGIAVPVDDECRVTWPILWSLLTQDTYKDSTVRVLPTLVINRVSGGYTVTLQDHASCQQCVAEANELSACFQQLERVLAGGGECFRPYKSFRVKDPMKRKKRGATGQ